ncbi:heat-shock protein, partial [Vibrio sp. S17_S38]|uniref:heat-shock protein n=1 Tax=Vibrio sp. S17_S38 TaxID=2720229 RepID=UPI001681A553
MKNKQIFNLNDNEVQIWKNFELGGIDYNFSHLNAKKITFTRPERSEQYTLFFTISHHVFTKGIEDDDEIELHWIYPHPTDKRQFDLIRYKLSLNLPQIIETLPEQFCYHGGYSRYCCCKIHQEDGTEIYYQV